ncbi:hypothetical protein EYZ11_007648 [Aspergillus tanneri]|uniref:Uncharacterized protein n=1 Tax=Aspergillus tanneri TaxID=1220188 RepID=A0A4S3JEN3_9EURO|nr:hypothetical protein EYZ11_007648 [Aspergillus tanneri]
MTRIVARPSSSRPTSLPRQLVARSSYTPSTQDSTRAIPVQDGGNVLVVHHDIIRARSPESLNVVERALVDPLASGLGMESYPWYIDTALKLL